MVGVMVSNVSHMYVAFLGKFVDGLSIVEQCLQVTFAMPPGSLRVITPKGHQSFPLVIPLVIITFVCNHNSFSTSTSVIHSEFRSALR